LSPTGGKRIEGGRTIQATTRTRPLTTATPARHVARGVSLLFVTAGLWGFIEPPVFGLVETNPLYNLLHLLLASLGLYFGFARLPDAYATGFAQAMGLFLLIIGVTGLLTAPLLDGPGLRLLNASHAALGLLALAAARADLRREAAAERASPEAS